MPAILTETRTEAREPGWKPAPRIDLSTFSSRAFDRGAGRLKEAVWILVKCAFFLNPLPLPSMLRVWILRRFGATVGEGVVIRSRTNITFPWKLSIGDHVWIGEEVAILSLAPVTIGSHVCISQRAFLCTGSHDFNVTTFDLITRPIVINDHSWVAAGAFVAPGVTVGEGSMVGAGVTVIQDVAEQTRLVPASLITDRTSLSPMDEDESEAECALPS